MPTIKITYYALLREQRGENSETIQTEASTTEELYAQLKKKYNFSLSTDMLKIAVNDQFSDWTAELHEGDQVVFIPPVAGG